MSNIKICYFFIAKNHFSFHIPSAFWPLCECSTAALTMSSLMEVSELTFPPFYAVSLLLTFHPFDLGLYIHYIGKAALAVFFVCLRLCDKKNIYDSKHGKFIGDFLLS